MRKAGAFVLLISLCYYYVISLAVMEVCLFTHKEQIRTKPETKKQITLTLTKSEFEKYKQGDDELRIKGEMYDIKKISFSGENMLVYCIHDEEETKILTELEDFFNQNIPTDQSSIPHVLFKFLSLVYIPSFYNNNFHVNVFNTVCFHRSSLKTISAFFPVSTPPPRGLA